MRTKGPLLWVLKKGSEGIGLRVRLERSLTLQSVFCHSGALHELMCS